MYIYIYIYIYITFISHTHTQTRTSHVHINPIAICILAYPGLMKTFKQLAYIWEETGCSPNVNITRIVLMTYWSHYPRVIEPFFNLALADN